MNQLFTYQFLLKSIIYLLLICQFWTDTLSTCTIFLDSDSDLIEFNSSEDGESEEDEKKEKDDKFQIDMRLLQFEFTISTMNVLHSALFLSLHHPDVTTPPPKL